MRRCEQVKCGYYLQGGCQHCQNCKAEPYYINTECGLCRACESDEGELRFGNSDKTIKEKQMKKVEVKH